jgi:selenide,water dikinase
VISTAIKKGKAEPAWIDAAVRSMTTLNKRAAEVITTGHVGAGVSQTRPERSRRVRAGRRSAGFRVNAMTDVTGFGLIGHAREMALASDVSIRIFVGQVPLLEGALECARAGHVPGGLKNNREFAECLVEYEDGVPEDVRKLLFDPQTAGGLLIATPDGDALVRALSDAGVAAVEIGKVLANEKPRLRVAL